jgi:hypothetical protein
MNDIVRPLVDFVSTVLQFVPFEKRYPPEWFYDPEAEKPCMEFAPVSMQVYICSNLLNVFEIN